MSKHKQPQESDDVVADRRPIKYFPVISHSDRIKLERPNDGMVRKYFSTNHEHPLYIGRFNQSHMIGDPEVGYLQVAGWKPCNNKEVKQEIPRPDQGGAVDSLLKRGRLIACELPEDEYDKYRFIKNKKKLATAKRLQGGIENYRSTGAFTQSVLRAERGDPRYANRVAGDHRSLLDNAPQG